MRPSLCYVALILVALTLVVAAQVSTGTLTGSVRDSNEAAIAGARVRITHRATSASRETVTDERGEFSAPNLRPGEYSVTITMTGFQRQTFTGIMLAVDQTLKLTAALQPGTVEQTVEVTAAAALVDSSTSSLGQVIDNKKIVDLPLNGRNPFALGYFPASPSRSGASIRTSRSSPAAAAGRTTTCCWMGSTTTPWRRREASE